MAEISIADALKGKVGVGEVVTVKGWVRTRRDSKGGFSFVAINDGSCFDSIQVVAPGTYDTRRLSTSSTWGLDFVGNLHGCNEESGRIVVHSVEIGPDLTSLKHFRVSFENHCDGRAAALRAEVAVLADPWR